MLKSWRKRPLHHQARTRHNEVTSQRIHRRGSGQAVTSGFTGNFTMLTDPCKQRLHLDLVSHRYG